MPENNNVEGTRLRLLDGLRFVAAFAVVLFHFTGRDSAAWDASVREVFPTLSRLTIYGGFGPYLFFMISGFVVLMSAWGRGLPGFVASRVARLYPAYWVAVVLTAVVLYFHRSVVAVWDGLGLPGVLANLTMFQSALGVGHLDGVYWTLWVELKFYLLIGLLVLVGLNRRRVLALCLLWPVLGMLAARSGNDLLVGLLEPNFAPFFCLGMVLYLVYREGWSATTGLLLGLNFCSALWIAHSYYVPWSVMVAGAPVSSMKLALLLALMVGAVAAVTLTPLARVPWRWATVLGSLTYPLYLLHEFPGLIAISELRPHTDPLVAVAVVIVGMLVLSHLVERFVERPFGPRLRRAVERDLARVDRPTSAGERSAGHRAAYVALGRSRLPMRPDVVGHAPPGAASMDRDADHPLSRDQIPVERHSLERSAVT